MILDFTSRPPADSQSRIYETAFRSIQGSNTGFACVGSRDAYPPNVATKRIRSAPTVRVVSSEDFLRNARDEIERVAQSGPVIITDARGRKQVEFWIPREADLEA